MNKSKYIEHVELFKNGKLILTSNSKRLNIKRYLLEKQNNKCSICGMSDKWNNISLIFVLDHIDGNSMNDIPSNLRLVCPNCDSQLPTFKSKNKFGKDSKNGDRYNREYEQRVGRKRNKRKMPGMDEEIALKATAP
jgi:hypothetical protein